MDVEFLQFSNDAWNHLLTRVVQSGLARCGIAILVAARLAGVLFVGSLLGRPVLTWPVRLGLVLVLTGVVTPLLPADSLNFDELETASRAEPVNPLSTKAGTLAASATALVSVADAASVPRLPIGFVLAVVRNAGIGAAMGLCVMIFLSGLRLGSEWFDRHCGLGMGSVLNPEFTSGGSAPAEIVALLCVVSLLVMQPVNGHLLVVRLILDSFLTLPVGTTTIPATLSELPVAIVQQSLILGLRIALPFVVAMSLLDLTLAYANRSTRWQFAPSAYVIRAGASLLILAATFPGVQEAAASSLQNTLQTVQEAMTNSQ